MSGPEVSPYSEKFKMNEEVDSFVGEKVSKDLDLFLKAMYRKLELF